MPRVRALVIVIACAVGAVLGMGTFAFSQAASGCGASSGSGLMGAIVRTAAPDRAGLLHSATRTETEATPRPALFQPDRRVRREPAAGVACEKRLGAAVAPDAAVPGGSARGVPASTATRHLSAPGERVGRRGANQATDRAMALLIGWGTLVLICGGLLCGRRRPEAEPGAEGRAPEVPVRVRVSGPRRNAPRHLLATPPHRAGGRDRPQLPRAIARVMALPWRGSAAQKADRRTGVTARGPVGASAASASAVAGSGAAGDAPVAGRATGRATEAGDTVVMRRIVLAVSAAPAGINGRRR